VFSPSLPSFSLPRRVPPAKPFNQRPKISRGFRFEISSAAGNGVDIDVSFPLLESFFFFAVTLIDCLIELRLFLSLLITFMTLIERKIKEETEKEEGKN